MNDPILPRFRSAQPADTTKPFDCLHARGFSALFELIAATVPDLGFSFSSEKGETPPVLRYDELLDAFVDPYRMQCAIWLDARNLNPGFERRHSSWVRQSTQYPNGWLQPGH